MIASFWSIALAVCGVATLLLFAGALRTAVRILRHWEPQADSAAQITLENETWLAALLVRYGIFLQLVSLLLLVLAADSFSHILVGAMCATGAFLANEYGVPALAVKLFGVFFFGFWLVLNRLDNSSEFMPLTRIKFAYLVFLTPLLAADFSLLTLYLVNLRPEILTSCCGVVFAAAGGDGYNLVGPLPAVSVMIFFYGLAAMLVLTGWRMQQTDSSGPQKAESLPVNIFFGAGCMVFFLLALLVITSVISPYIYAMPSHRCPFDILQAEYHGVGYPLYISLMLATFAGASAAAVFFLRHLPGLEEPVRRFRRMSLRLFLLVLPAFLAAVTWFPAVYLVKGGE